MSIFKDQADFMAAAGQNVTGGAEDQAALYSVLIEEEFAEFLDTENPRGKFASEYTEDVKEAVDVIVVATGYLISRLGADRAQAAWDLVHAANKAKVVGGVEKRADGKVMQNSHYKAQIKAKLNEDLLALVSGRKE